MKRSKASILLLETVILVLIFSNYRCRDPFDFKPPADSLIPAPAAPLLTHPVDGYVLMPNSTPYEFWLTWDAIDSADAYERDLALGQYPPWTIIVYDNRYLFTIRSGNNYGKYSWRVRAISTRWLEGYTPWSDYLAFEVRSRPHAPHLICPADGSVFYLDCLTVYVNCHWDKVSDEQFYEVKFMKDTTMVEQNTTSHPQYDFITFDTGTYYWAVRAGSSLWQQYTLWAGPWSFVVAHTNRMGD